MSHFVLSGRWVGEPYDPDRFFLGTVTEPGHTGLTPGDLVRIRFDPEHASLHRTPTHQGSYALDGELAGQFVLASFVREACDVCEEAMHDGEAQLWGGELFTASRPA